MGCALILRLSRATKEKVAVENLKKQKEDEAQRSQLGKWVLRGGGENEPGVAQVEKLATVFGDTKKNKNMREKEQRAAAKKKREKLERGKATMQKRSLFEWGGGRREVGESPVNPNLTLDEKLLPVEEISNSVPVSTSWVPKSEIRKIKSDTQDVTKLQQKLGLYFALRFSYFWVILEGKTIDKEDHCA